MYDPAVGRFMGVDPLAEKYNSWSPYTYTLNNPVRYIDPDGREVKSTIVKGAGESGRDLQLITVTGKLINFSNNNVNMQRALSDIKSLVETSYQGKNINGKDIKVIFDFSIAESMQDVLESDHLIVLAEGKNSDVPGTSNSFGGKVSTVDADYFTGPYDVYFGEEGERTSAHELGHLLFLKHRNYDKSNLMSQGRAEIRGNNINANQLKAILQNLIFLNSGTNYNPQNGLPNIGKEGIKYMKLTNVKGRTISFSELNNRRKAQ